MPAYTNICASCGGKDLQRGKFLTRYNVQFKADSERWWTMGTPVLAMACMQCGAVWPFLDPDHLPKLRERLAARSND